MSSGYETIMVNALARLKATPPVIGTLGNIRRAHRTAVPRDKAPAVHLVDGVDRPTKGNKGCGGREGSFTVSIFGRSDTGVSAVDAIKVAIMNKMAAAWPAGVTCYPGQITHDVEIADEDAIRIDMDFELKYPTTSEWALELAT